MTHLTDLHQECCESDPHSLAIDHKGKRQSRCSQSHPSNMRAARQITELKLSDLPPECCESDPHSLTAARQITELKLSDLPPELIHKIIMYLNPFDWCRTQLCSPIFNVCTEDEIERIGKQMKSMLGLWPSFTHPETKVKLMYSYDLF